MRGLEAPRGSGEPPHLRPLLDADIAELDEAAVAQEADVAAAACQTGVVLKDGRFFHHVEIGVQDNHAVERHFNAAAVRDDLFLIPLA